MSWIDYLKQGDTQYDKCKILDSKHQSCFYVCVCKYIWLYVCTCAHVHVEARGQCWVFSLYYFLR